VLTKLSTSEVYLSGEDKCWLLTSSSVSEAQLLSSNQEEADTKILLHAKHAIETSEDTAVHLLSPSGDTDILVLVIALMSPYKERVFIINGSGAHRKTIWLGSLEFEDEVLNSLIGFHAFTGNDFVSSFFRKSKEHCWKVLEKNPKFYTVFQSLGSSLDLSDYVFSQLQEFLCHLYRHPKEKEVNTVRYRMFTKKNTSEHKIIDISVLPPCESVFHLHCLRANTVTKLWKSCTTAITVSPDLIECGWNVDGSIKWQEEAFPSDVEEILVNDVADSDSDSDVNYGSEVESEDSDF